MVPTRPDPYRRAMTRPIDHAADARPGHDYNPYADDPQGPGVVGQAAAPASAPMPLARIQALRPTPVPVPAAEPSVGGADSGGDAAARE
jgi:hypothetical protein